MNNANNKIKIPFNNISNQIKNNFEYPNNSYNNQMNQSELNKFNNEIVLLEMYIIYIYMKIEFIIIIKIIQI